MQNLGPLFSGPLEIKIFKVENHACCRAVSTPLKSFGKNHVLNTRTHTHTDTHTSSLDCAHGRKERFAQKPDITGIRVGSRRASLICQISRPEQVSADTVARSRSISDRDLSPAK